MLYLHKDDICPDTRDLLKRFVFEAVVWNVNFVCVPEMQLIFGIDLLWLLTYSTSARIGVTPAAFL